MNNSQITLEFSSDKPVWIANMVKFTSYAAHLMDGCTNSSLAIETVKNGIIFIYANYEILKQVSPIYTKTQILNLVEQCETKIDAHMLLPSKLTEENYPKAGISFQFKIIQGEKEKIIKLYQKFFAGILDEGDLFKQNEEYDFIVQFASFESFYLYLSLISLNFQDVPEELHI